MFTEIPGMMNLAYRSISVSLWWLQGLQIGLRKLGVAYLSLHKSLYMIRAYVAKFLSGASSAFLSEF